MADARRQKNDAASPERRLVKQERVDQWPLGVYGDWRLSLGNPRHVLDQDAVHADVQARGKVVPLKDTTPGLVVTYIGPGRH